MKLHTLPIYPGMTPREAWQHVRDAGVGNAVPEFEREVALGRKPAWITLEVGAGDEIVGLVDAAGELTDPELLDEPFADA